MPQKDTQEAFKQNLIKILAEEELTQRRYFIKKLCRELHISFLDCAAALSFLDQSTVGLDVVEKSKAISFDSRPKTVQYRLEIGYRHKVSVNQIKDVLVEVSGVDRKRIEKVDMHNDYTLVNLPEGMSADIFQLLSETKINQHLLKIKRIKSSPKYRHRNKRNNYS